MFRKLYSILILKRYLSKSLGGLDLIVTFKNREDRKVALENPTMTGWFRMFKHWNGEPASLSRLVWLKCRGMPLNTWALSTFKKIGDLWGNFVTLDHETLSESSYDVNDDCY